ncbi:MAG TPA: hypothetical protein VGG85_06655 [Terracidiphilus sp.]
MGRLPGLKIETWGTRISVAEVGDPGKTTPHGVTLSMGRLPGLKIETWGTRISR